VEDSPDIDVLIAFDVGHEVGKPLHRQAAQSGKDEFQRVARRPERRTLGDRPIGGLKRLDEIERDIGACLADVIIDGRFDVPAGQLAEGLASRSPRFCLPRPVPEIVEIRVVDSRSRRRLGAFEQQVTQPLPILIDADQLPNIFAAGGVSASGNLVVDE
jgi:hypothetical protein